MCFLIIVFVPSYGNNETEMEQCLFVPLFRFCTTVPFFFQTNGNHDCGLYAIANTTAIAFGRDPSKEQYIPSKMREHLIQCLDGKEKRPFPTAKGTSKRQNLQLYCVCKMHETHTIFFFVTNVLMSTTQNVLD